ncbi:Uma2 family endonuclease [Promicromonospora thailandica]|uniref:Endonuclease, Uma2 family (Restriction endonuclease fold) n=1 Tax=Promicromonospora thailandica TaxID=765201 RepID=A0A9X2GCM4_9MICO|nr:Uma2 family endonuclease [Promicromonospora thailandica]MCP2267354.1 Endonuclease, Uma2 family (restriction endonuclease fold) [Promicromonospora thailandica]
MPELPDWMRPPRPEGWLAEDLDNLPDAPRHTELIDGVLVFMMSPQRNWHRRVINALDRTLAAQAPEGFEINSEMTVRLDDYNRPEPDVIAATTTIDRDATWYEAKDVVLAVEVVSPESQHRDNAVKPRKYAEAGIGHFWRVDDVDSVTTVHVYELDDLTRTYVPTGIFRDTLTVDVPFPVELDVQALYA